jgi:hypothetical protein
MKALAAIKLHEISFVLEEAAPPITEPTAVAMRSGRRRTPAWIGVAPSTTWARRGMVNIERRKTKPVSNVPLWAISV